MNRNKKYSLTFNFKNRIVLILSIFLLISFLSINIYASDDCIDDNGIDQCIVDPNSFDILDPTTINLDNSLETLDSNNSKTKVLVYFTGIGCPHCAKIDPILFNDLIVNNKDVAIIEYEVKHKQENAQYMLYYNEVYNSGYDIPVAIFDKDNKFYYNEISNFIDNNFNNLQENVIPLPKNIYDGEPDYFENINLDKLKGRPVIWKNNRALEKTCDCNLSSDYLIELLNTNNVDLLLENKEFNFLENKTLDYSQGSKEFKNSIQLSCWRFYWNDDTNLLDGNLAVISSEDLTDCKESKKISFLKVSFLALADSVNPCALAVLLLMLMSIVIANPNNKKVILKSGLCFILAVLIMYFIYGLLLIKVFAFLDPIRVVIYKVVALFAIVLGVLEVKDFFNYKPGSLGTEMPISLRPTMKKFVSKITSPKGAFFMGLFVTLFLLPCTIGPYIILGSMLSINSLLASVPLLLWYNVLFVVPMLIVILLIYFGMGQIKDVQEWKEKNIKYLHLIAGIVIIIIGILMFFGLI